MTLESYLRTAGPPLAPAEIKAALRGQLNSPLVKAVLEVLVAQLVSCNDAATVVPSELSYPEERHFNAGAAAATEQFLAALGEYIES